MKQLVLISFVFIILLCSLPAACETYTEADNPGFTPDWFQDYDGYVYSTVDKLWYYSQEIRLSGPHGNSSATVIFKAEGNDTSVFFGGPAIRFSYRNTEKKGSYAIEGVDLLIGDTVFSYPRIPGNDRNIALIWVGEKDKDLFAELANASAMSVRIITASASETFELTGEPFARAKEFASGITQYDIWKYASDDYGLIPVLEEHFPLIRY